MDVRTHNRKAWDKQVENQNPWTLPVSSEAVAAAKEGRWDIFLTPTKPVPKTWFPELTGARVLCLASGGGQQGPLLAAAGADVTVFDNSSRQLAQDRMVAERDSLSIRTVEGDMRDLSVFADESFDLIIHPVSNSFVPDVRPVWMEAARVLRHGACILAGFTNPVVYLFDEAAYARGELRVTRRLPHSDAESLSEDERKRRYEEGVPIEFSHTLDDQIGGQLDAGLVMVGFYDDSYPESANEPLAAFTSMFIATRARKP